MQESITVLVEAGFRVRGDRQPFRSDNHSANVNSFSHLVERTESVCSLYMEHENNEKKSTYFLIQSISSRISETTC